MFKKARIRLALLIPLLLAALSVGVGVAVVHPAHAAGPTGGVLILDTTVTGGYSSYEAQAAASLGLAVTVVDGPTWDSMTTAQFASYQALILGDPQCSYSDPSPLDPAVANLKVWAPTIKLGGQILIGTDPSFHTAAGIPGAYKLITDGIKFAVGNPKHTGIYISLSCYYFTASPGTPVPVLNALNPGFTVEGQGGCPNNAVFIQKPPAFKDMTNADIQNWNCSIHAHFDTFPSKFVRVARDADNGLNYILAHRTDQ